MNICHHLNNHTFKCNSKKYLYLFRFQQEICRVIILSWPANLILGLTSVQLTFQGLYFLQALSAFTHETGVTVQIIYSTFQRRLCFKKSWSTGVQSGALWQVTLLKLHGSQYSWEVVLHFKMEPTICTSKPYHIKLHFLLIASDSNGKHWS